MGRNQENLVKWTLKKVEEYLSSAANNLKVKRLFPAAEEIFRAVETLLEALLFSYGIRKIEYPGTHKKFKGRLALQFLVRDNLLLKGRISRETYDKYLALATELHLAGYRPNKTFEIKELKENLKFAEDLLAKVKTIVKV